MTRMFLEHQCIKYDDLQTGVNIVDTINQYLI